MLNAEVRKRVLTWKDLSARRLSKENKRVPNILRAYVLADRRSELPAMAPSGVRQDMFVEFIMRFKYSRGSLAMRCKQESLQTVHEMYIRHRSRHIDSVFPFELGPHAAKLQ